MEGAGDLVGGQHGADREAAAQRFGAGQNIRGHAVVHIGEQRSGTPHTTLYFIKDEQRLVLIAQLAQSLQESRRGRRHAAFALNRLHHHRAGVVIHHRFYRLQIVEGNMDNIRRFWAETIGILRLTADGNGKQGAAMKGIMESDDFGFIRAMAGHRIVTRQLKGRFIGFGAGVHKHHALGEGSLDKFTSQTQRRLIGKDVAGVPQRFALLMQRRHQRRMAMAKRRHRDTAGEIDILFPLLIPDAAAFPLHRDEFCRCINWQNNFIECGAGDCRLFSCHVLPIPLRYADAIMII